jgi:hypothetical protein
MDSKLVSMLATAVFDSTPRPGRCYRCQRIVNERQEFRDHKSYTEWKISHLCQQCQDLAFRNPEEEHSDFEFPK